MTRNPFNQQVHDHLKAMGYFLIQYEAEFDDGDPENGPGTWGCPAYDEYSSDDEYIVIGDDGNVVHREERDLEQERCLQSQFTISWHLNE